MEDRGGDSNKFCQIHINSSNLRKKKRRLIFISEHIILANLICAKRFDVVCLFTLNNTVGEWCRVGIMLIDSISIRYTLFLMRIIP